MNKHSSFGDNRFNFCNILIVFIRLHLLNISADVVRKMKYEKTVNIVDCPKIQRLDSLTFFSHLVYHVALV